MNAEPLTRARIARRSALSLGGVLALAGCGGAGTTAQSPAASKAPVRLHMYNQTGAQSFTDAWAKTLELAQGKLPHVTYDIAGPTGTEQFVEKAVAMGAGGTPPDFTYSVTRNGPAIFTGGLTHDMNPIVRREKVDLNGVAKNVLDDFTWEGTKLMSLPVDTGYAYIQYNKTLFERAGQPDPAGLWAQGKWDWDAFVAAAVALQRTLADSGGAGFTIRTWEGDYLSIIRTHGGELLTADRSKLALDEPNSVQALARWGELHTRLQASAAPDKQPQGGFRGGLLAMVSSHPGEIVPNQEALKQAGSGWSWDVVPHPVPRGGKRTPTLFTNGLYLWKNTKHEATTIEVLKTLVSNEGLLKFGQITGRDPAKAPLITEHARNLGIPQQDPKSYVKLHQELTPQVKGLPHTTNYLEWHGIVQKEVLIPIGSGQKSPQDATRAAAPAINALLARGKGK